MLPFGSVFYEIAAVLAVAAAVGGAGMFLRQPLIVSFIATGILVGPAGMGWVTAADQLDLLAKLGIALLLFVVGLRLDLHLIRTLGGVALATGLGQVVFTSVIGYLIALALGMTPLTALYVSVALTFSSTIIIVKLLSDKREIDALHGRIALGFLIVQDLVVVIVMLALSAYGTGIQERSFALSGLTALGKGAAFLGGIALMMRFVLPGLIHALAKSRELLVLFSIAWAVALAATSDALGFSKEIGAFVAGVSLASTGYRDAIGARLTTLRDFLLLFFFIDLGAQLKLELIGDQLWATAILSLFVLVGNPLIVMVIMGVMGYRKRTGFLAGLTVAQISEFSLLFGALGVSLGHITSDALGLITMVGLVTIGLSTYMILYSHKIYAPIAPWLGVFEREQASSEEDLAGRIPEDPFSRKVVVLGLGRFGSILATDLAAKGVSVIGVDFDPSTVRRLREKGVAAIYGDAEDPDLAELLPLPEVRVIVSTIPFADVNRLLLQCLKSSGYLGQIVLTTYGTSASALPADSRADGILDPFKDAGTAATETVMNMLSATGSEIRPAKSVQGENSPER